MFNKGKSGGFPGCFDYDKVGDSVNITANNIDLDHGGPRRLDPWGLAFRVEHGAKTNAINFAIAGQMEKLYPNGRLHPELEAFRRRISFLSINNPEIQFKAVINGQTLKIDDADTLFVRPESEEPIKDFQRIAQNNRPGRLEKDFQTWLYADDVKEIKEKDSNSNERLAVLGEDFLNLKNRSLGIIREFPTWAFYGKPSNDTRILPKNRVDIVTLNKHGYLSIIELKLNDPKPEVIAQLMDYSLFFRCYRNKLKPIIKERLGSDPNGDDFICYVVNNHFHKRFDDVMKYYRPKNGAWGFEIKKVELGRYS